MVSIYGSGSRSSACINHNSKTAIQVVQAEADPVIYTGVGLDENSKKM